MEEKIFNTQAAVSFNLQLFATNDELELSSGKYVLTIGGKKITCDFTGIEGITLASTSTNLVTVSGSTITIGNETFELAATKAGTIKFNDTSSKISSVEIPSGVSVKTDGITYNATNNIIINFSGDSVTLSNKSGTSYPTVGTGNENLSDKTFIFNPQIRPTFKPDSNGVTIDGIVYKSPSQDASIKIDREEVTLDGTFTVTIPKNNSVTLNGTYFDAKTNDVTFTYNSDDGEISSVTGSLDIESNGVLKVNGVTYDGEGDLNFTDESSVNLGGDFSVGAEGESLKDIDFTPTSGSTTFNLGDGKNETVKIDGVTYAGSGAIEVVDKTKIKLSGGEITVGAEGDTGKLDGKTFTTEDCEADFNCAEGGTVTINNQEYTADTGDVVKVNQTGNTTLNTTGEKEFTLAQGKSASYNGVEYTAKSSNVKVVTNEKSIEIISGTVALDAENLEDYSIKLSLNSTAQIFGVDFKKTGGSGTSDADIVFESANSITLNSALTIGDGTQKLNGLQVTLNTADESIFKLGSNDSVTVSCHDATSNDVSGDTITGVTFAGTGTVSVSGNSVSLSGGNMTVTSTVDVSGYTFSLTGGNTYTFGKISIVVLNDKTPTVSGISGTLSASTELSSITIDSTEITLNGETTVQQYGNTWATAPPYESYVIKNNKLYGVYNSTETEINSVDGLTINNGTATLTGDIKLKVEGSYTVVTGGNTYSVSGGVTFDNGKIELDDNASVSMGNYTYEETETQNTTATISVDNNGGVTVDSGVIKKTINSGTFTYGDATYTVGTAAEFKVGDGAADGDSLIGGNGTRSISGNYTANNKTYTALNSAALSAVGDNSGGYVTFNGTFTLPEDTTSFEKGGHTYTTSKVTYSLVGDGSTKIDSLTKNLYAATGTRGFETNETADKTYSGVVYTVTNGTYSINVTNGEGTEILTAGNASKTYSTGNSFSSGNKTYTATSDTTINLSFNGTADSDVTISGTGGGTRTANGDTTTYSGATYNLSNGATILFTLNDKKETFYNGSATRTTASTFQVSGNDKTYTASNSATLTLTKENGGSENVALTSGSGTRSTSGSFTYRVNETNQTYNSSNIVYVLEANADDEKIKSANGTRTVNSGSYTSAANNTYDLTAATYTINITDVSENATENLTGAKGSKTLNSGDFYINNKTYSVLNSATLSVTVDGSSVTESLTAGSGTRESDEKNFTYNTKTYSISEGNLVYVLESEQDEKIYSAKGTRTDVSGDTYTSTAGNTYDLTAATYSIDISGGATDATYTLENASGSANIYQGSNFYFNSKTYAAMTDGVTLGLEYDGTTANETFTSGKGTRTGDAGNFTYNLNNVDKTYTSQGNIVYILDSANPTDESIYAAEGTRAFGDSDAETATYDGDTYTVTDGTYKFSVTNGTDASESLQSGNATYSVTNSAFHFDGKEYTATAVTNLQISIDGAYKNLTSASGEGTRTATGESTTATYDGYTYNLSSGSTKKITIANKVGTEEFYNGSATRTATNSDFNVSGNTNTYTSVGNATLTLSKTNTNGGAETVELTSGSGTRTAAAENGKFTYDSKEYTTSNDLTYILMNGQTTDSLHSAQGTRAYSGDVEFNEDTYTTAGTYDFELTNGTAGETLTAAGTYSTSNGTFHYGGKTYSGFATFTISYNGTTPTAELTSASGKGTRTLGDETFTYSNDGNSYNVNSGATIKLDITDKNNSETFYNGTATQTYTAGSGTFNYKNQTYTAHNADATLTLTKTNGGDGTAALSGAGTRSDNAAKFTYSVNGQDKEYTKTSTNIIYRIADSDAAESVYTAKGERSAQGDTTSGNWGNKYTLADGSTYSIDITAGAGAVDTIKTGVASAKFTNFKYGTDSYTATTYGVTLSLSVTNNTPTEKFESGSAKNSSGYIIKSGSKADIGAVTYQASDGDVITVEGTSAITEISGGKITGTFENGESSTIGNIAYSAANGGTLEVSAVDNVKSNSGEFTAKGNFATARTIDSKTLNITGDADVTATFSGSGITKLENLNNGAVVVNAAGATTAYAVENGTYKFGAAGSQQTFVVSGDDDGEITFTLNNNGLVTGISALGRSSTAYATVNITETDGQTYTLTARSNDGDEFTKGTDGKWSDKGILRYVVTYENNNFTVEAVDKENKLFTLADADYSVADTTKLTLTDTSKPIVVMNKSISPIDIVDKLTGIESTGNNAIQIETSGDFQLGTFDTSTNSFTAGKLTDSEGNEITVPTGDFKVDDNGKFTVEDDGTIVVEAKNPASSEVAEITVPNGSSVDIKGNGNFRINGGSLYTISNGANVVNEIVFNEDGTIKGINPKGAAEITISYSSGYSSGGGGFSFDLAESADIVETPKKKIFNAALNKSLKLAESADVAPTFMATDVGDIHVAVTGDDDAKVTLVATTDTSFDPAVVRLTGLKDISEDATVVLNGSSIPVGFTINGSAITKGTDSAGTAISDLSGKKIIYKSTGASSKAWVVGLANAQYATEYKVEINSADEVILKVYDNKTRNVNDYKAAFTSVYPDDDGAALPKTKNLSTLDINVSEITITPSTTAEYDIGGFKVTISSQAKFDLSWNESDLSSLEVTLTDGESLTYEKMTFTANGGSTTLTLPKTPSSTATVLNGKTKVTGAYSGKTFTAKDTVTFDDVVIKDVASAGTTITPGANSFTIDGNALNVTGDSQYTVSAASNQAITGISNGAIISGAWTKNSSVVTDSEGTFNIGTKNFVIAGDGQVTLKTSDNSSATVSAIDGLSDSGSLSGNLSGVTKINTANFGTDDTDIGVVGGESKISKIYGLTGGKKITNAGGAATISTDGNGGKFNFGNTDATKHQFSISGGTADFLSSAASGAPVINGIKNINGDATVAVYQDETGLQVEGNLIKLSGNTAASSTPIKLVMHGDTVSGVENVTSAIEGLSEGATVKVAVGSISINQKAVQIKESSTDYTVYAKDGGYGTIKGVGAGATIESADKDAIIIPEAKGTFTFGTRNTNQIEFSAVPSLKVDGDTLKEISGLTNGQYAVFKYDQSEVKFDEDTVALTNASSAAPVTLVANENGNVAEVKGLTGEISGLTAGASVEFKSSTGSVKINGKTFTASGDDMTVRAKETTQGYDLISGIGNNAVISAVEGNVSLVTNQQGVYTFGSGSHKFEVKGDNDVTFKTSSNGASIEAIDGLTSAQLLVYQTEADIQINGTKVNVPAPANDNSPVTLNVDGLGNITSVNSGAATGDYTLPAGAVTEIETNAQVKINNKTLQIDEGASTKYTVRATANGYDLVTGLSNGATVTTASANVSLVTDNAGTFNFNGHTLKTDDEQITLRTGNSNEFTMVGGIDGDKYIELYQTETGLNVNGNLITVAGATTNQAVKLTMGSNDTIAKVENLRGNINGLSANATLNVKTSGALAINSVSSNLNISNDTDYTVRTTWDGYDYIAGIGPASNIVNITTVKENTTLVSDKVGKFTFDNSTYTIGNDDTVSFVTTTNNSINAVYDLDGTIGGNFTSKISVDGKAVKIEGDTSVSLKANGEKVTLIDGLSSVNGANTKVINTGGASSIKTNSAGTFIFGDAEHKFKIENDSAVTLRVDEDANVTSISGLSANNASLTVYQDEEEIKINGEEISLENVDITNGITLNLSGSSTIKGVTNLKGSIKKLTKGATVQVATDDEVIINDVGLQIDEGSNSTNYLAYADDTGYSTITSVGGDDVNITKAENASIVTDAAGTYTFGNAAHKFKIAGDTTVTLVTDGNSNLTSIGGFDVENALLTVYQSEDNLNINNKQTLTFDGVSTTDTLSLKFMSNGYVKEVGNLKGNIKGLSSHATVNVKTGSAIMINDKIVEIDDETTDGFTVKAESSSGYSTITGIDAGAAIKQASNATIVNDAAINTDFVLKFGANSDKTYTFNDTLDGEITLATDASSKVLAISGLSGTLQTPEQYNTINGAAVFTTSTDVSIVAASSNGNGISSLVGLTDGHEVSVPGLTTVQFNTGRKTGETLNVTINGVQYNLLGDADGISIRDNVIEKLDATARLTVSAAGEYLVNGTALTVTAGQNIIIGENGGAHLYKEGDVDFGAYTPAEDIIKTVFTDASITASNVETVNNESATTTTVEGGKKSVVITSNSQTVQMAASGGQLAIVQSDVTGAIVNTTGEGDTIISAGEVTVNLSGTKERLMPTGGSMNVTGYNHEKGAGIQLTNSDVVAAVRDMTLDNSFTANSATVNMTYSSGKEGIVNFYDLQGNLQKVGYAYTGNSNKVDASTFTDDIVLKRTTANSTLLGGSGNDTAFGSAGDYFNLGYGDNYISIASSGESTIEAGAGNGVTTVEGFTANDFTKGVVKVDNAGQSSAYFTSDNKLVIASGGGATLQMEGIQPKAQENSISYVNVMIADGSNSDNKVKTSIARENKAIKVARNPSENDDSEFAKAYVGENSGVDLSDVSDDTSANLQAGTGEFGNIDVTFRGITSLKGGTGKHTLIGADTINNTIEAGKGEGTLRGGEFSSDLLIGVTTDSGKTAATTFIYDGGNDTISNFSFSGTTDKIEFWRPLSEIKAADNDIIISDQEGNSLTIKKARNVKFDAKFPNENNTFSNRVGSSLVTYDGTTDIYWLTDDNATIEVGEGVTAAKVIDISNEDTIKGNVTYIDATNATGQMTLIGSLFSNNTIQAGSGGNSIYGGDLSTDDLLIGYSGNDTFRYGGDKGNDTIKGYDIGDIVRLDFNYYSQVKSGIDFNASNANKLCFSSGNTLTFEGRNADVMFVLNDGTKYNGFENLKNGTSEGSSSDLAYDDWEINGGNELIDGDAIFWDGNGESGDLAADIGADNYLTDEIMIGDINPSVFGGDKVYNFNSTDKR